MVLLFKSTVLFALFAISALAKVASHISFNENVQTEISDCCPLKHSL